MRKGRCISCGDPVHHEEAHWILQLSKQDPYVDEHPLVYFCYKCGHQLVNVVMESEPRPEAYHSKFIPLTVKFTCETGYGTIDEPPSLKE